MEWIIPQLLQGTKMCLLIKDSSLQKPAKLSILRR